MIRAIIAGVLLATAVAGAANGQQVPDTLFVPVTAPAAFGIGAGPRLVIDGGHHNFHTVNGRYAPFARLAARDGYRVSGSTSRFSDEMLSSVDVLVIANALNAINDRNNWSLPTPSAFADDEIAAVRRFVERGGALLMIADHMPFAGATEALGAALGVSFVNGFAYDAANNSIFTYTRAKGMLAHPVFEGRNARERIDSVVAFTGSAFWLPAGGAPLMTIPAGSRVRMPSVAWQFSDSTASVSAMGMLQGAALRVGKGRVAVSGEAAMFSAQRAGPQGRNAMGFNAPAALQNAQYALNVLHWLSGFLPDK
ncbi:MAG: hypothetical protein ABIY52_17320 [Gemmatimonadaceae bacterium]